MLTSTEFGFPSYIVKVPISKSFLGGGRSGLVGYEGQSKGIRRGTGNHGVRATEFTWWKQLRNFLLSISQENTFLNWMILKTKTSLTMDLSAISRLDLFTRHSNTIILTLSTIGEHHTSRKLDESNVTVIAR